MADVQDMDIGKTPYYLWGNKLDCLKNITAAISIIKEECNVKETPVIKWHRNSCQAYFMSKRNSDLYSDIVSSDTPLCVDHNKSTAHSSRFFNERGGSLHERKLKCSLL